MDGKMIDEDGFTVVNPKAHKFAQQKAAQHSKADYKLYARRIWPEAFKAYLDKCMAIFYTKQPMRTDETRAIYDERCKRAADALRKRTGDCGLPFDECFERGHVRCEENRRAAYDLWKEDCALREDIESIQIGDVPDEEATLPTPEGEAPAASAPPAAAPTRVPLEGKTAKPPKAKKPVKEAFPVASSENMFDVLEVSSPPDSPARQPSKVCPGVEAAHAASKKKGKRTGDGEDRY